MENPTATNSFCPEKMPTDWPITFLVKRARVHEQKVEEGAAWERKSTSSAGGLVKHEFDFTLTVALSQKQYKRLFDLGFDAGRRDGINPEWIAGEAFVKSLRQQGVKCKLRKWGMCRNADDLRRRGTW